MNNTAHSKIFIAPYWATLRTLQWRHNERDGVSNHRRLECLPNHLASPLFTQPFVQAQIKENIKAPHHWLLWGESTGHLMTSSCEVQNINQSLNSPKTPHPTIPMCDSSINSVSMEMSFCSHRRCGKMIATKFYTWHDSKAVVPCAKFRSDVTTYSGVTHKPIFHRIWITMDDPFVKWAPRLEYRPLKGSDNT